MKRCMIICGAVIFALLAVPRGDVGAAGRVIKVGLLAAITGGSNPDWGKKQAVAMEMAVAAINQRGGVYGAPVAAVIRDTGQSPEQVRAAYRKLVTEDGVLAVIGPLFSDEFESISEASNTLQTVIIATGSSTPGLSNLEKRPFAFRMTVTSDKKEAPAFKAWALAHRVGKVAVVYDGQTVYTSVIGKKVWPAIMKQMGIALAGAEFVVKPDQKDFSGQVEAIKALQPDGICIALMTLEAGHLIGEIRRQGLQQPILGSSTIPNPKVIEIAGVAAEGIWSNSLFYPEDPNPKVQAYVSDFKKRCEAKYPGLNSDPEQYDVVVYDSFQFLADIMKKEMITGDPGKLPQQRNQIRSGLANMGVWRGTTGMLAFDKLGDGIRTVHILKVKDGKWQPVY